MTALLALALCWAGCLSHGGVPGDADGGSVDPATDPADGLTGGDGAMVTDAPGGSTDAGMLPGADSGTVSGPDSGTISSGTSPGFPRLASVNITSNNAKPNIGYGSAYAQFASKMNLNIMGANWVGAGASLLGGSRKALIDAIHSQSKIGSKVFQYHITDNTQYIWPVDLATMNSRLLYKLGSTGACVPNFFFTTGVCNTNQTLYTTPDSNGLHLEGAVAKALVSTLITGSGVDAAPNLDGIYHDNLALTPYSAGDYARNGKSEPAGDETAGQWMRDGFAEGVDYLHAHSSLLSIGNIAGWGQAPGNGGGKNAAGLSTKVQGGQIEGTLGKSYSIETWGGFAGAKGQYQFAMANVAAPKLVIVHHSDLLATGVDPYGATPYQAMRYGLTFALMDDGYYASTQNSTYYNDQLSWFDEYAVDPTTGVALTYPNVDAGLGYLGHPTDAAWPAPLATGVYARHFTNATTSKQWLVLVNPKGNGAKTVALGGSWKKLNGSQAHGVNDGSTVTSVVLQDRDGLILMKP